MTKTDLIERLEGLLEDARKGEITGLSYFAEKRNATSYVWGYVAMNYKSLAIASTVAQGHAIEATTNAVEGDEGYDT